MIDARASPDDVVAASRNQKRCLIFCARFPERHRNHQPGTDTFTPKRQTGEKDV